MGQDKKAKTTAEGATEQKECGGNSEASKEATSETAKESKEATSETNKESKEATSETAKESKEATSETAKETAKESKEATSETAKESKEATSETAKEANKPSKDTGESKDTDEIKAKKHKSNEEFTPKTIFQGKKLPEFQTGNIFTASGNTKVKKESGFLKMDLHADKAPSEETPPDDKPEFSTKAVLAYFEDGEWIEIGAGEAVVKDGVFYFIRDFLKIGILKIPAKEVQFKKTGEGAMFKAKGRRSTGDSFEIVDREYRMEFLDVGFTETFFKLVK